jgi:hypothetical protein
MLIGSTRSGGIRSADAHELPMGDGEALIIGLTWTAPIELSLFLG